jgi:uncharacterized membrane protein YbhN (UPF0104 family)
MSIVLAVFAIVLALYAFGCYRADGFFDRWYQWKTREEDPRRFWIAIAIYSCLSLALAALAVYSAINGQ